MSANNSNKPNHLKDLILLFAIPIGIAIFAAIVIYAPSLFTNPKYDFIYSVCDNYDCSYSFNVDSSGYVAQYGANQDYYNTTPKLYYYNTKDDSSRSINLQEARHYQLNTSSKSPDGYSLVKEDSQSGFLFWGNSTTGWYLKNGAKNKKVELSTNGTYYSRNINFLGWVNK